MKNNGMISRVLLVISGLALLCVLFVPIWRIDLEAPQYPEGLYLLIYSNKLGGNIDIINGLNHYIGMKTLHTDDFAEFTILPYAIVFFAVLFFIAAIAGKRNFILAVFILFALFGVLAMIDFYKWEYDYGHNLNPDAAIKVPGMSYQPPLIGYKQLLNFSAYSMPYYGGWLFIAAGVLSLLSVLLVFKQKRKSRPVASVYMLLSALLITLCTSCTNSPEPFKLGNDNCYSCKMTITDPRFGIEVITKKGKVFKFDDTHCANDFLKTTTPENLHAVYCVDFSSPHALIEANKAFFYKSESLHSPMGGNTAAFQSQLSLDTMVSQFQGAILSWKDIYK